MEREGERGKKDMKGKTTVYIRTQSLSQWQLGWSPPEHEWGLRCERVSETEQVSGA